MKNCLRICIKACFIGLFVLASIHDLSAQQKVISGTVTDAETNETLIG